MKFDRRFPRQIVLTLAIAGVLALYPLFRYGSPEIVIAAAAGAALSTVNVLLGYLTIEWSFGKSYSTFLKAVLGGMGVRMLFMVGVTALLILFFRVHALALTVSLLGFYGVYMVLEILFIQRKVGAGTRE